MSRLRGLVALLGLAASVGVARADGYASSSYHLTRLVSVGWEAARPLGGLADFVGTDSPRGAQFELRFAVARQLSLGVAASWSWLAENQPNGQLAYQDALITGPVYHRVQLVTLRATAHWLLTPGAVQPYLGAGAGVVWYDARAEVADLAVDSKGWGFTAGPEAGLLVTVRPGLAIHLQVRYQWTPILVAGEKEAAWLAVNLGLAVY